MKTRSRLEDRVVGAEGVLEDALDVGVVLLQLPSLEGRDVDTVERDHAAGDSYEPKDHLADGRLPAAALADERHDLARRHIEADIVDGQKLGAAERAHAVGLAARVELQHHDTFQHATDRPGPTSTKGGSSAHFANASGHRVRNLQPEGGSSRDGGRPGMPLSRRSANRTPTSGSDARRSWVYGCFGELTIASEGPFSASLPAYMTRIVSAIWYSTGECRG